MAYAPDEITLNEYPKSNYETVEENKKEKSCKKLKKETFKNFLYFHWLYYWFTSNNINLNKLSTKESQCKNYILELKIQKKR